MRAKKSLWASIEAPLVGIVTMILAITVFIIFLWMVIIAVRLVMLV